MYKPLHIYLIYNGYIIFFNKKCTNHYITTKFARVSRVCRQLCFRPPNCLHRHTRTQISLTRHLNGWKPKSHNRLWLWGYWRHHFGSSWNAPSAGRKYIWRRAVIDNVVFKRDNLSKSSQASISTTLLWLAALQFYIHPTTKHAVMPACQKYSGAGWV